MRFFDRREAGRLLAVKLDNFKGEDIVLYGLPRGGVLVAKEVAEYLKTPFDLLAPRKVGHPNNPEYAICAVSPEGDLVCSEDGEELKNTLDVRVIIENEKKEASRRLRLYLGGKKQVNVSGKIALIVDDGIATGLTMRAAIASVKHRHPSEVVVAVPIASMSGVGGVEKDGAEVVVVSIPDEFKGSVGYYYRSFPQISDKQVIEVVREARGIGRSEL